MNDLPTYIVTLSLYLESSSTIYRRFQFGSSIDLSAFSLSPISKIECSQCRDPTCPLAVLRMQGFVNRVRLRPLSLNMLDCRSFLDSTCPARVLGLSNLREGTFQVVA